MPTQTQIFYCQIYQKQVSTHLILDQEEEGVVLADVVGSGLKCYGQQTQPHVDHHIRVVAVNWVGEGDKESEQLSDTG